MVDLNALFNAAKAAQAGAHAPYSKFHVGAAILSASGKIHSGCNVENAAYPAGTCAEAGVIAAMCAAGDKAIAHILVIGPGADLCFPCGACRQRIREFSNAATKIHIWNADASARESFTMEQLLPRSFGPGDLGF